MCKPLDVNIYFMTLERMEYIYLRVKAHLDGGNWSEIKIYYFYIGEYGSQNGIIYLI